jgi:hypothetical protein
VETPGVARRFSHDVNQSRRCAGEQHDFATSNGARQPFRLFHYEPTSVEPGAVRRGRAHHANFDSHKTFALLVLWRSLN